jgi:anti-sigma factor RsiW
VKCQYEHDDGVYVLGALSPAERAAYENHLAGCPSCHDAVADIAALPGLLGRLTAADVAQLPAALSPSEPSRLPELLIAAQATRRRERRRRRWAYAGAALVAACLAVVVGIGATVWRNGGAADPPQMVAMRELATNSWPVTAQVALRGTDWGTEVTMTCAYGPTTATTKSFAFRLVARDRAGETEQVASWHRGSR